MRQVATDRRQWDLTQDRRKKIDAHLPRGTKEARHTNPNFVNLSDRTKAYHRHELSDGWRWFTCCKKCASSNVSWHNFKSSNPWHNITKRFPSAETSQTQVYLRPSIAPSHLYSASQQLSQCWTQQNCVCVNILASRQYRIRCQLARQQLRLTTSLKQTENSHSS